MVDAEHSVPHPGSQSGAFYLTAPGGSLWIDGVVWTAGVYSGSANTNRLLPALGRSSGVSPMKPEAVAALPVLTATY